jgi:hypothetical protein
MLLFGSFILLEKVPPSLGPLHGTEVYEGKKRAASPKPAASFDLRFGYLLSSPCSAFSFALPRIDALRSGVHT